MGVQGIRPRQIVVRELAGKRPVASRFGDDIPTVWLYVWLYAWLHSLWITGASVATSVQPFYNSTKGR